MRAKHSFCIKHQNTEWRFSKRKLDITPASCSVCSGFFFWGVLGLFVLCVVFRLFMFKFKLFYCLSVVLGDIVIALQNHAYSNIQKTSPPKTKFSDKKKISGIFSYFCLKDTNVDYFRAKHRKKNNVYPCKPQFYYIKVRYKGWKLYRRVFVMTILREKELVALLF